MTDDLENIGKIFTLRWVASSFNAVKAVDYPALARQFRAERRKFRGLHKLLTGPGFFGRCMKDVLRELQNVLLRL